MKPGQIINLLACTALLILPCGCEPNEARSGDEEGAENSPKLCGFKDGHGVFLSEESRQALQLGTMEVSPKVIPHTIRATARVFAPGKASMLVDTNTARAVKPRQRVLLDNKHEAVVVAIQNVSGPLRGDVEVIVGFADNTFSIGAHIGASLQIERSQALPAVPNSSLLETATGDYVFVANGPHFLRTPVKVAGKSHGWVAIADGLLEGDLVITNGVEALWCIELQATKGGYACCAVAKKE